MHRNNQAKAWMIKTSGLLCEWCKKDVIIQAFFRNIREKQRKLLIFFLKNEAVHKFQYTILKQTKNVKIKIKQSTS